MVPSGSPSVASRRRVLDGVRALLAEHDPRVVEPEAFWGAQFDHGLAWVGFPEGAGGLGVSPGLQPLVDGALRAAGAPDNWNRNPIGVGVAGPAVITHGSDEQARRHLRPLFTCAEVWCQLYSEAGAGSDLAGVATTAVRTGDHWVVNGRKRWITLAHVARWGLLLARSEPGPSKHRGLTCFVLDMRAPGVEVRPLRQITGDAEFDEVVITDVPVPDGDRLGDVGRGWDVALTTLAEERAAIGDRATARAQEAIGLALRLWEQRPDKDPALRDRLTALWVEAEVARLTSLRAGEMAEGGTPGPQGAIAKLVAAELNQRIHELCIVLSGPAGMLHDGYGMTIPDRLGTAGGDVTKAFLRSRASTLEAGTSEVMRTVLGERVLGLPPEPRVESESPRSEH